MEVVTVTPLHIELHRIALFLIIYITVPITAHPVVFYFLKLNQPILPVYWQKEQVDGLCVSG